MKLVFKKKYLMLIAILFVGIFSFLVINNTGKNEKGFKKENGLKQYDYNEVQVGDDAIVGTDKVTFDAYFLQGNDNSNMADKYRGASINVSSAGKLWIELKMIGDATFKDAYIEFNNKNVNIKGAIVKDTVFGETIISNNITRIPLNEISTGTTKLFYLSVEPALSYKIDSYYGVNKVTLKGTVEENGVETQIEKEVAYEVNFYGDENSMETYIERTSGSAPMIPYGSDENVTVTYNVKISETKDLMLLKSTNIEAYIGQLNGYDPLSVTINSDSGFDYNYDSTTNKLTATREAVLENDRIIKSAYSYQEQKNEYNNGSSYYSIDASSGISKASNGTYSDPNSINKSSYWNVNNFTITVVYPNAASYKTGTASVSLDAWHEGFNNNKVSLTSITNSKKTNRRLIANYQCDDTKGVISTLFTKVKINKDTTSADEQSVIDSTNLGNKYNGVDSKNVYYSIDIEPYIGGYSEEYPIGTFEIYDLDTNYMNETISFKQYEKYYSISLSSYTFNYLGNQGYIKVIDADTNEILHVFTPDNVSRTYMFDKDVRSIRLEVSDLDDENAMKHGIDNSLFRIKLTKEIDTDYIANNVSYDEYKTWEYLQTKIRTDWNAGDYSSKNDTTGQADAYGRKVQRVSALFTEGLSRASLSVDTTDVRNQLAVTINTLGMTRLYKGYVNGEFLIEMPDVILDYDVVETTIDYEKLEIDGKKLLKIRKSNDNPEEYNIVFHLDIVPDARVVNKTIEYKLYAYNPNCHNYANKIADIYDVNNNNNKNEYVGYAVASMNLIAPSEVITAATLENYNTNNNIVVSPMIAEVDPTTDNGDGKVNVHVINNSGFAIKDIKVMGKIAFIGNKHQMDGSDLGSEFNTQMTSAGIKIPEALVGKVTVYYSEEENPSDSLSDTANGWTETPANFANVKSYMILVNDYEMVHNSDVTFEYNITMPTDTDNLLKKAYFTHAVYFNLVTESGLVATNVGSSKLGVTMVRKYNLNIDTLRKGTDKEVDLLKYEIEDEDGNIKTFAPSSTSIEAKGLYVGKTYKLRQVSISNNYEIDTEEKTFVIENGTNDELEISTTGTIKSATLNNSTLNLTLENYPRYTVVLKNTDFDTDEDIYGAKFRIEGKGYNTYSYVMTNENGEVVFKNLYLNELYRVYEQSSPGHQALDNYFVVTLKYDDATGEAKLGIKKLPRFSNPTATQDSASSRFNLVSNVDNKVVIHNNTTTTYQYTKGYIELDLTGFDQTYYVYYDTQGYIGHIDMYATDYFVNSINNITTPAFQTYNHTNNNTNYVDGYLYNAYKSDGTTTGFVGGKKYYIYINQYSMNSSRDLANISFEVRPRNNADYVNTDLQTFNIDDKEELVESLVDDLNSSQPIMNVKVKNHAIPTIKLKITKKDSDTKDILPNALYRLSGPGINDSVILKTDENGEFDYNIYINYTGNYQAAGYPYLRDTSGYYSLKEVSAPSGYSIDKNTYNFRFNMDVVCPSTSSGIECTKTTATYNPSVLFENAEFSETTYDEATNTLNVTVYDYPLVKIVKKDSETGTFLPNTMFAIYKVTKESGKETLSDAYDVNGKIVGDIMTIDGETYRVITTDKNGSITLNLEKGQYKLKEVQASSDKYDISKQTYYFGVGETVPYQAEGINFTSAANTDDIQVPLTITNDDLINDENVRKGTWQYANDDGFYYYNKYFIAKYDKNSNLVWIHQNDILTDSNSDCMYHANITFTYPDKEPVVKNACLKLNGGVKNVYETGNGEVFIGDEGNINIIVSDDDGNKVTHYYPYIHLNSNGEVSTKYKPMVVYTDRRAITTSDVNRLNGFNKTNNDDEVYTTYYDYYNSYNHSTITYDTISGKDYLNGYDTSNYYGSNYLNSVSNTSDGSYLVVYQNPDIIIKYDANGNFVKTRKISDDLQTISNYEISSSHFSKNARINFDSEGNILLTAEFQFIASFTWNGQHYSSYYYFESEVRLKYDSNLNLIYVKASPVLESNDKNYYVAYQQYANDKYIYMKDNDGYYFFGLSVRDQSDLFDSADNNIYTNEDYFMDGVSSLYDYYVFEYDKDGKPVKAVKLARSGKDWQHPETNKYTVKGIISYQILYSGGSSFHAIPYEDGFLVATYYNPRYSYSESDIDEVTLASGEKIKITGNYIIYKVNQDSKVVWLKQFDINYNGIFTVDKIYRREDGSLLFHLPSSYITYVKDMDGNYLFGDDTGTHKANILIYNPSAEVLASGPEKYELDIKNEAKKFDIKVTSDDGSTYSVKNSNGQEVFNGSGEYKAETVKYEENSENEITITLKPNHALKNVTLNGKDFTYQVNSDGTITLDKIPNITEDKVINIETVENVYSVVVHHYLENTTDRIASDEILTGAGTDIYEAKPFISNLYSLITDQDGNYIIPANASLEFQNATGDVIFYYKENEVELNVNYYVENTSDELKPTLRQRKLLGSRYTTTPAEIEFYNLTGVAGEENGVLNQNLTTVSYFYQQVNESTITVKHLDINTGAEVAPTETLTVAKDAQYTTNASTNIPANYEYVSRTSNAIDTATHENIEVIYYYRVTPFNVSVDKKIDKIRINGKDITISDSKLAKIEPNKGDEVIIYYEITLKNDGAIKAEFRVVEQDVDNFVIYDLGNFIEENGEYVLKETLEPGEEKTYKIGYKWEAGHYGKSKNKVEVTDVKNARGFSEPDALDNISETVVIINVPTGLKLKFTFVILAGIIVNGGLIMLFIKRGIRR